jgi:hypothetical protein
MQMGGNVDVELGNSSTTQLSLGSTPVRTLYGVASGAIRLAADGYGKSSGPATPSIKSYFGATGQYYTLTSSRLSQLSSVRSKFGTKSLLGSTDSNSPSNMATIIPLNSSNKLSPGSVSGTYTAEYWVYMTKSYTAATNYSYPVPLVLCGSPVGWTTDYIVPTSYPNNLFSAYPYGGAPSDYSIHALFQWGINSAYYSNNDQSTADVPLNQWIHTAFTVVNNGINGFAVWVNGVRRLYVTSGIVGNPANAMQYVGLNFYPSTQECYVDEIRISNIDRYGVTNATITLPAAAFTPDANTMAYINFEA